jgi:hypothetical protein
MPICRRLPYLALCVALPLSRGVAQEHAHGPPEQLGKVTFAVSCAPDAQQRFERAMTVLHSFWWEEGPAAFAAVLAADSACAMAHWGLAMNAWGNPFAAGPAGDQLQAGAAAAERAAALGGQTSREAGFIAAVAALYRAAATTPNAARLQAYADTMARVYRDHPGDDEIAIYYALSLVATAPRTDTTFANQKRAAEILNPLYALHTDHPGLAHYIIHANDSPHLAQYGLDAARRYAGIAPSAPHAQHMPSHIFVRLGMWDETIASNWKSYEAGVAYAKAQGLPGVNYHEFHALDYAVYGYLQRGMDREARRTVALAESVTTQRLMLNLIGGYNRTAMEARLALERGDWAAAAAFPLRPAEVPIVAALVHFTRGIGAARSGSPARANLAAGKLDSIASALARRDPYWARVVRIKAEAVVAWARFGAGQRAAGLALAKAAADSEDVTEKHPVTPGELLPARELEADMLLAAKNYAAAQAAYRATLAREPGRARSLFGVARSAELAGDLATARTAYAEFLKLMEKADGDRAEIGVARKVVEASP